MPKGANKGEPTVVAISQLAPILREWGRRWSEDRPRVGQVDSGPEFMGPWQWLSQESGIHVRRIGAIVGEELTHIGEQQAELLLMAIDREYMLATGEVRVYPNPGWSLEKWLDWRREQGCI